ncbi:hypothetical protein [Thermococcus waiotapuensis]|uniref:Uncharacterized protein n=1 Tax=Thermococcus waiotapuensis TaxID=90909 RepID=A0AAE4NRK5_9EURY|nr:hypothetical protein [Thermococcus waiotapuensis]MDV3103018.1 hypothetical protein [Thermococcus waiotapuensis]
MVELETMKREYRKLMLSGLLILLLAFALLIFAPFGRLSLLIGLVLFPIALVPLELARRTAHRMVLLALSEGDGKA